MKNVSHLLLCLSLLLSGALPARAFPFPEQEPLRRALISGSIKKHVLTNGNYRSSAELVCEFEGKVPVYAPLDKGNGAVNPVVANCHSGVGKDSIRLQVMASVMYEKPESQPNSHKNLSILLMRESGGEDTFRRLTSSGEAGADGTARLISLRMNDVSDTSQDRQEVYSLEVNLTDDSI